MVLGVYRWLEITAAQVLWLVQQGPWLGCWPGSINTDITRFLNQSIFYINNKGYVRKPITKFLKLAMLMFGTFI